MPVTANFAGPVQTDQTNRFRMLQSIARSHLGAVLGQKIPTGLNTALKFDTNDINTDGLWSGAANTRFTAQIAGNYLCNAGVAWPTTGASVTQQLTIRAVRANGTTDLGQSVIVGSTSVAQVQTVADVVQLSAGEYVEFVVSQNTGVDVTLGASTQTFGAVLYVGE